MTERSDRATSFEPALEAVPVGVVILTGGGVITWANSRAEELLALSRTDLDGRRYDHPDWDIWDDDGDPIPLEGHPVSRVLETGETVQGFTHGITLPDGSERWLSSNAAPLHDETGSVEGVVVALEEITKLKRIERLVDTLQPVIAALNGASTRDGAQRAVCDRLTATPEYDGAWVADTTSGYPIEPTVQSGDADAVHDETGGPLVEPEAGSNPAQTAVETGEVQFVTGSGPDSGFGLWWESTRRHGFHGSAIVPLASGGQTYGILGLYTARPDAFDAREQALLKTVGDRFGQLIHALEVEQHLHADTVAELTFRSTDSRSFLIQASGELRCTIDIMDTIPVSKERLVYYASVRGAPPDALVELVENETIDGRARPIRSGDGDRPGGELELAGESLADTLVRSNAVVTKDTVTDGEAEVVCEVPADTDIESLVTRLTDAFPETTLVAKREYDRPPESVETTDRVLSDTYRDALTDRQRQVLRAAVYGGYFESPRRSTATEIADALSLTQSTVSYHLREAQRTLFDRVVERP